MQLTKLNMRGLAHVAAPLLVVVLVAVAGIAFLVGSHADSCTPKVGCGNPQVTCYISGIPTSPTYRQTIKPKITITNSGKKTLTIPVFTTVLTYLGPKDVGTFYNSNHFTQKVKAGQTVTHALQSYKVPFASSQAANFEYMTAFGAAKSPAVCYASAPLPQVPTKP